jgi:uncharacterized membrane protein
MPTPPEPTELDITPPPPEEGLNQAARPRSFVAGPSGHPLHPAVASVAVAAWVFSAVFDLGSFVAEDAWAYTRGAYVLTGIGVGAGIVAAVLGLIDLLGVPAGTKAHRLGIRHLVAMDATLACFALSFVLRRGSDFVETEAVDPLPFALSLLGLVTLATGVWLGHRLAYGYGVRVNTDDDRRRGFDPA